MAYMWSSRVFSISLVQTELLILNKQKKRKRKERRSFSIFYVCKRFYVIVTTNHCPDACKAIALILDPFFKCNDGSLI